MEAVPRLPMLSFDLKISPENTSFSLKLKQYIAEVYHEDPDTYSNEIHQLEGLRSAAVRPAIDLTGCAALKRYFSQLRSLQSRFPMSNNQPAAVSFSWKDLFANIVCVKADIRFEMLCILYNIAALHCKLGALENRNSQESMKIACTHFQTAVWAFQYLRDQYPQPSGVDLCPEIMKLFQDICLAQAQECILEKSMQDNRKPGIVGSVAMQILIHYKSALAVLEASHNSDSIHETIGVKVCNTWVKAITFKIAYITSVMNLFQGMQSEEQQNMGERVAYYEVASDKLAEAKKNYKNMPQIAIIKEALSFTTDVIEGKKKAAKNENEFIYHEEVPALAALSDPKPAALAKGVAINFNDAEVSGPDIFAKLVPMGAHEASSMYSEEKAKLLRQIGDEAEEKDLKLSEFMSSLQLEHLDFLDQIEKLPQELVDRCASLSVKTDAIQNLIETMNNLADIHTDVDNMLTEIRKIIQVEEANEKEYQKIMAVRPPSIVSTELSREANKYQEAHNRANDSNQTLHKAMMIHLANLKILSLSLDEIETHVPSVKSIKGDIDEAAVSEIRMLVNKVKEMQTQRTIFIIRLKEAVNSDDITSQLLTRTGEALDDIFKQEIGKHDKQVDLISHNLKAQENILKALTEAYARYAPSKKLIAEVIKKRESFLAGLISSFDTYEDLMNKSLKGLEFYKKLSTNVSKLLTRVKSTCKVQEEERSSLLANNASRKSYAATKSSIPNENPANIPQVHPVRDTVPSSAPKLKDYLPYMKNRTAGVDPVANFNADLPNQNYPPYLRPAPVGSEGTNENVSYQHGEIKQYDTQLNPSYQNIKADQYAPQNVPNSYTSPYMYYGYDATSVITDANPAYGYNYSNPPNTVPAPESTQGNQIMNQQYYNPQSVSSYQTNYSAPINTNVNTPVSSQVPSSVYSDPNQYDLANQVKNMSISSQTNPSYAATNTYDNAYEANVSANQSSLSSTYNPPLYGGSTYGVQNPADPGANYASNQTNVSYNPYPNTLDNSNIQSTMNNSAVQNVSYPQYPSQIQTQETNIDSNPQAYSYQSNIAGANAYAYPTNPNMSGYDTNVQVYAYQTPVDSTQQPYSYQPNPDSNVQTTPYSAENSYAGNTAPQVYSYTNDPTIASSVATVPANSNYTTNQEHDQKNVPTPQQYDEQPIQSHVQRNFLPNSSSNSNLSNNTYPAPSPSLAAMPENNPPQQYPTSYTPNQYAPQDVNSSYQNHPGYAYNQNTGVYDYSYGYQNNNMSNFQPNDTSQNNASQYTNAGGYGTVQTNSSNVTTPNDPNVDNKSPYYSVPYGQQNATPSNNEGNLKIEKSENQQSGSAQNNSSLTYMSSNKTETSTTDSTQGKHVLKSSPSIEETKESIKEPSAMDLLSGLDFTVEQEPLMPEIKVPPVSEHVIRRSVIVREKDTSIIDETDNKISEEMKPVKKDLYSDPSLLNTFTQEVKNLQVFVDSFTKKTHSGITMLDSKWKKIQDAQNKEYHAKTAEIAKNNMDKNASPDVYPYDDTRVAFKYDSEKTYVNASHVKQISTWSIPMIVSDLPKEECFKQFWTMIYQQKINVIVCLLTEIEMQGKFYWPVAKNLDFKLSPDFIISLNEITCNVNWTERSLTLKYKEDHVKIMHYQINMFPSRVVSAPLVLLVDKVLRANPDPKALIHCSTGGGRSALIVILTMIMCQVRAGCVELREMLDSGFHYLCGTRTNVLEDTKCLVDIYRTVLFYVQGVLCSGTVNFNGEAVSLPACTGTSVSPSPIPPGSRKQSTENLNKFTKESFEEMKQAAGLKSGDMKDPLSYLDPLWSLKKRKE